MMKYGVEVLSFIRDFRDTHQYGPTMREIQDAIGWGSVSSAQRVIVGLEHEGLISKASDIPRTISLTEKGVDAIG